LDFKYPLKSYQLENSPSVPIELVWMFRDHFTNFDPILIEATRIL